MDKKVMSYCRETCLVTVSCCVLVLASISASSCGSTDHYQQDACAAKDSVEEPQRIGDFAALHRECSRGGVFLYGDMGSWSGYSPPARVKYLLSHIAAQPKVVNLLDAELERLRFSSRFVSAASAVFPLIDLCLWVQIQLGTSTATIRAELWQMWQEKFALEMRTQYRAKLSFYEAEILSSVNALVNR